MYFPTALTLAAAALTSLPSMVSAAPTPQAGTPNSTYHIEITGLPKSVTNDTVYLVYEQNFLGECAILPSTNKSLALLFHVESSTEVVSTSTGLGIEAEPLPGQGYTSSQLTLVPYNASCAHIKGDGKHPKKVVSDVEERHNWLYSESQYSTGLGWATANYSTLRLAGLFGATLSIWFLGREVRAFE